MFIVILLSALALWALTATIVEVRRDGSRPTPTDWARVAENDRARRD